MSLNLEEIKKHAERAKANLWNCAPHSNCDSVTNQLADQILALVVEVERLSKCDLKAANDREIDLDASGANSFRDIVELWQMTWMHQTQNNEADYKNYWRRAFGIDANMRYSIEKMCESFHKRQVEKLNNANKILRDALFKIEMNDKQPCPIVNEETKNEYCAICISEKALAEAHEAMK